jgi:hypothetical protein
MTYPASRFFLLTLAVLAGVLQLGCGHASSAVVPDRAYTLSATLDKSVYRPGEAIEVTVSLYNNTNKNLDVPELDAQSMGFWFGRTGDSEKMERKPIYSEKEPLGRIRPLGPGETIKRRFLLTQLTQFNGAMSFQAHYNVEIPGVAREIPKLYSNAVPFDVSGPVLFNRDATGLIQKSEAIGLAQEQTKQEVLGADAVFVDDEMGFHKCWVNLKVPGDKMVSYFVDPYLGRVWGEAKAPFSPKMTEDNRRQKQMERKIAPGQKPAESAPAITQLAPPSLEVAVPVQPAPVQDQPVPVQPQQAVAAPAPVPAQR